MTDTVPDEQIDPEIDREIRRLQESGHSEARAVGDLLQDGLEDLKGRERLSMALTILGDFLDPPLKETEPGQLPPTLDAGYQLLKRNRELEQLLGEALQRLQGMQAAGETLTLDDQLIVRLEAVLGAQ